MKRTAIVAISAITASLFTLAGCETAPTDTPVLAQARDAARKFSAHILRSESAAGTTHHSANARPCGRTMN